MGPLRSEPHQLRTNKVFHLIKSTQVWSRNSANQCRQFQGFALSNDINVTQTPYEQGGEECSTANCFNFGTPKKIVNQFFKSTMYSGTGKILAKNQKLIYWPPNNFQFPNHGQDLVFHRFRFDSNNYFERQGGQFSGLTVTFPNHTPRIFILVTHAWP